MSAAAPGPRPVAAGVDVGGTKLLAVTVDADGAVLDEWRAPAPPDGPSFVAAVVALGLPAGVPVGLGVAGLVDRDGVVRSGPNLPGYAGFPVGEAAASVLGAAVVVDNDATCATWAEARLGAAGGCDDAVLVTLGTGIGCGLVVGGALVRGASGFAGEAGHMVVDPAGPVCVCGKRGCWERYASGAGIARLGREAAEAGRGGHMAAEAGGDVSALRGEHVVACARRGDTAALGVLDEFSRWVALGVANLVNLLDPEVVVLGGGLVGAGDLFLGPVREHLAGALYAAAVRTPTRVELASLGERAGAVGAALLAAGQGR